VIYSMERKRGTGIENMKKGGGMHPHSSGKDRGMNTML